MRALSLLVSCPAGMLDKRAVTLNGTNFSVAYTAEGAVPTHVTISDAHKSHDGTNWIEVKLLRTVEGAVDFKAGTTPVPKGSDLQVVGTEGKLGIKTTGTSIGMRAYTSATANAVFSVSNIA